MGAGFFFKLKRKKDERRAKLKEASRVGSSLSLLGGKERIANKRK